MHRGWIARLLLCSLCWVETVAGGQKAAESGASTGRWIVTADYTGTPIYYWLQLKQDGDKLSGEFAGDKLEGTASGGKIHFLAKDEQGGTEEGDATVQGATMSGT